MRKLILFILVLLATTVQAQFFIETGLNTQMITFKTGQSPLLVRVYEQEVKHNGKPISNFPERVVAFSAVPMINIGYRIPFDMFDLTISKGSSQDFKNTFELERKRFMLFFHYYRPIASKWSLRLTKNFGFLTVGFDESIDTKTAVSSLQYSNLKHDIKSQIPGFGENLFTKNNVTNRLEHKIIVGVQKLSSDGHFQVSAFTLFGESGGAFVGNLEVKLKASLGKLN